MLFIHKISKEENTKVGLNYRSTSRTLLTIKIIVPIWTFFCKKYFDFPSDCLYSGWRMKCITFRLRIRRWKTFPKGTKKVLFNYLMETRDLGKPKVICTREMLEDNPNFLFEAK